MLEPSPVRRDPSATLFVSDPTPEAETVTRALRANGYDVVDVPLLMLVARAAVQRPRVVLVDADSQGAFEVVARMRELPHGDDILVLFIATAGGALASPEEAIAHEGSGLFVRPIDISSLIREISALTGDVPTETEPPFAGATGPTPTHRASAPPFAIQPGLARSSWSSRMQDGVHFSSEPPTSASWVPPPRAAFVPPVSADLQRLLAEAERRAEGAPSDPALPPPEQEIEAMLPAELLAALDEPLGEEDNDPDAMPGRPATGVLSARERTHDGGSARTTGASTEGSGATPPSANLTAVATGEEPTPPPAAGRARAAAAPRYDSAPEANTPAPDGTVFRDGAPWAGGPWNAMRVVAHAVATRVSGSLCVIAADVERRVVLREGDIVTCASTADDESLLAFLGVRGELPRETVRRLGARFPPFGRHAGAALVARGYLRQDQMWPTLRAHAQWLLGRVLQLPESSAIMEARPPGRLGSEPDVFGGGTGAAAFVEVARRVVAPADAVLRLGGWRSRLGAGEFGALLAECGLLETEVALLEGAPGLTLREVLEGPPDSDFATVILALSYLGVIEVLQSVGPALAADDDGAKDSASLDSEAIRERVRARLQLVEDGDYFAVLGVPRDATGYEIRRAFLELRRAFDPSRWLSPELSDLTGTVRDITSVLEEAYEILKDAPRRERYRRAIEDVPGAPSS